MKATVVLVRYQGRSVHASTSEATGLSRCHNPSSEKTIPTKGTTRSTLASRRTATSANPNHCFKSREVTSIGQRVNA